MYKRPRKRVVMDISGPGIDVKLKEKEKEKEK
jgi:hypothetical protein